MHAEWMLRDPADDPVDPIDPADAEADRRVLSWGSAANPNTVDGELQNMAAFASAASRATGWRRHAARLGALIALGLIGLALVASLIISMRGN
jgi:hypothetical protein